MEKEDNICPICNHKLNLYYLGLVCKNWKCPLYYKLETGWIKLTRESNWSKKRTYVNLFFDSNKRLFLAKEFAKVKREVLIRDDYTCQKCKYDITEDYSWETKVEVHHIVQANEEMALYLDLDNLITLCRSCHKKIHQYDKRTFNKIKGVEND